MAAHNGSPACNGDSAEQRVVFSFIVPRRRPGPFCQRDVVTPRSFAADLFREGLLLNSTENDVPFPVVHIKHLSRNPLQTQLLTDYVVNVDFVLHQGLFRELRNITAQNELPVNLHPHYIMLGFKNLERNFNQVLVDTWKDWTGARHIYMYLPDDLGLKTIRFFHREAPEGLPLFNYVVVAECATVETEQQKEALLDFARRLRLRQMTSYISVYDGYALPKITQKLNGVPSRAASIKKPSAGCEETLEQVLRDLAASCNH